MEATRHDKTQRAISIASRFLFIYGIMFLLGGIVGALYEGRRGERENVMPQVYIVFVSLPGLTFLIGSGTLSAGIQFFAKISCVLLLPLLALGGLLGIGGIWVCIVDPNSQPQSILVVLASWACLIPTVLCFTYLFRAVRLLEQEPKGRGFEPIFCRNVSVTPPAPSDRASVAAPRPGDGHGPSTPR